MILRRQLATASVVISLALGVSGTAFADVSISNTGANSNQTVTMNNKSDVSVENTSNVVVSNVNVQGASTGNVSADKNTSVLGGIGSGNAMNNNSVATIASINNPSAHDVLVGGVGASTLPVGGSGSIAPGVGGKVLGASTGGFGGGAAVLPEVGASVPVDVSALRAAWHPQTNAATSALAKSSQMVTGFMLLTATLLSVLGALGSAWYARKREERV
jgi:hypothetical protein